MNQYLFELHLPEKARFYISMINSSYAQLVNYKKNGEKAIHEIDKDKGLEKCKSIVLDNIKYYIEKLEKELGPENFKIYKDFNRTLFSEII